MVFAELIRYRESDKGRDKRAGAPARAARKGERPVLRELERRAVGEGDAAEEAPNGWMILAEGKGKGSTGHRDSIKIEAFGSRAHPPWNRKEKKTTNSSRIHQIPSKIMNFHIKSGGEIGGERGSQEPTNLQSWSSGEVRSRQPAAPSHGDGVAPRRIKKLPERSREHQSGEEGTAGGGSRTPDAQREEGREGRGD